ncbi:MAG: flagellar hook-associated protein FlgL [Pseudomonadota bacterium]
MTTRISSAAMHSSAIAQILAKQSELSKTQNQVASGKRVDSPSDDPIAATRILDLTRSRAQLEQYGKNSEAAVNRLNIGEQALADIGNVLQRVRELTVQANSASLDATSRTAIATEIRARVQELQDIGNRRDANGEYLYSGYSTQTQPFSRSSAGVSYAGDQGVRNLQVSADQRIADSFSGQQVFLDVPQGNGTFMTTQAVHNGTGSIDPGQVVNAAAWVRGTYTLQFTAANAWEVRDAGNALVASGAYISGGAIAFNGVQVSVTGAPAVGDSFTIAPAGSESIFDTLDQLAASLTNSASDPVGRSSLNTDMAGALTQLDQALGHAINLRAEVGARLSLLDNATDARLDLDAELSGSLSDLRDLDYAEAVSRMNQQLVGLQAAQAAYSRIAQLSLFDYL